MLILTSCSIGKDNEEETNEFLINSIISPEIKINEEYYRGVLPYKRSPINGTLSEIPNQLDSNHFELVLLELAKRFYDPSVYIFQEGQVLGLEDIDALINAEKDSEYEGFLYSISEHNYLLKDGTLAGLVIGLVVSPQYYEKDENGEYKRDIYGAKVKKKYTDEEILEKSKSLVNELTTIVREKSEVPIYFGVMEAEITDMKVPGTFFLTGEVTKGEKSIYKWSDYNEAFLFLPADINQLNEEYGEVARGFTHFKDDINQYVPRFAGITGLARFVDNNLVELTIEVYTEFDSTVEVIQLTQFAIAMIPKYFTTNTHISLYVSSIDEPKSIYIRDANGEDFMHIYKK
ncbi:MAG: CamS family sex pheromone protein [Vulcanibacillus sp.]